MQRKKTPEEIRRSELLGELIKLEGLRTVEDAQNFVKEILGSKDNGQAVALEVADFSVLDMSGNKVSGVISDLGEVLAKTGKYTLVLNASNGLKLEKTIYINTVIIPDLTNIREGDNADVLNATIRYYSEEEGKVIEETVVPGRNSLFKPEYMDIVDGKIVVTNYNAPSSVYVKITYTYNYTDGEGNIVRITDETYEMGKVNMAPGKVHFEKIGDGKTKVTAREATRLAPSNIGKITLAIAGQKDIVTSGYYVKFIDGSFAIIYVHGRKYVERMDISIIDADGNDVTSDYFDNQTSLFKVLPERAIDGQNIDATIRFKVTMLNGEVLNADHQLVIEPLHKISIGSSSYIKAYLNQPLNKSTLGFNTYNFGEQRFESVYLQLDEATKEYFYMVDGKKVKVVAEVLDADGNNIDGVLVDGRFV